MNIGSKITELRKKNNWSQEELANLIESSRVMIGKYERGDNSPSVEVLLKLAKTFNVTVDYLLGEGEYASFDKKTVDRINNIQKLDANSKQHVFALLDAFLRDYKAKKTYASLSVFLGGCFLGQTVIDNTIQVFDFFC